MDDPPLPHEGGFQESVLRWLDSLGWEVYGLGEEWGGDVLDDMYDRHDKREVVYQDMFEEWLIDSEVGENDRIETHEQATEVSDKLSTDHDNLVTKNREYHEKLRKGVKYTIESEGHARDADEEKETIYARPIDFEDIDNNRFVAVNEFRVETPSGEVRPDINLFVNGIPIVTMELKSIAQDNDYQDAIDDLQEYQQKAPDLFVPGLFNVAADQEEYQYAGVGAPDRLYHPWNDAPEEYQEEDNETKQAVSAMCNHETLLDILGDFVFHQQEEGDDLRVVPRYMQYYAVKEILRLINETDQKRGLVWHAQGSGKSYTMLFATKILVERSVALDNPQVFIVVDTDDLCTQMARLLSSIDFEHYDVAKSGDHLQSLIEDGRSGLVLTTIQKFGNVESDIQENEEVVVMSDEAHRYMEKDLGTKMNAALPDAYHFGFTGTPVRERERDTFENFGHPEDEEPYLHRYRMGEGIRDGVILPVHFDSKELLWDIDEEALDEDFDEEFSDLDIEDREKLIRKYVTQTEIAELRPRVAEITRKIDQHYHDYLEENDWKGMVVTPSRRAAALYGEELLKYRNPEEIAVLYTSSERDAPEGEDSEEKLISQFHTTSEEREEIIDSFKQPGQNPKIVVVCDMLLTGFDAPVLKTMYLDRNLKNHKLLQAIARTNRPEEGKSNGEILDFQGVFNNLEDALEYDKDVRDAAAKPREHLFESLEKKIDELLSIFDGIERDPSQETLVECLSRVSKHPNKRKFKKKYREARDLYETLEPDKELVERGIRGEYRWLSKIYVAFRRSNNRERNPEKEFQTKTRRLLEEHADIEDIESKVPVYELTPDEFKDMLEIPEPGAKANTIAHATREHLQPKAGKNPKYRKLSERVEEIITDHQEGAISDEEAAEEAEELAEEVFEFEEKLEEQDMGDAAYAIQQLAEDYPEAEDEAADIAKDIWDSFRDWYDENAGYEGWRDRGSTRKNIREMIINRLVKEHQMMDLAKEDDFLERSIDYLLENATELEGET